MKTIYLDINLGASNVINLTQFDIKSEKVTINLLKDRFEYDLTGKTVRLQGIKADKKALLLPTFIKEKNVIEFEITEQLTVVNGIVQLQLLIFGENGSLKNSKIFAICIDESLSIGEIIASDNDFKEIKDTLTKVDEWDKEFADKTGKLEEKYTTRLNGIDSQMADIPNQTYITGKADLKIVSNLTKQLIYSKNIGLLNFKRELQLLETTNKIININILGTSIACGGIATDYRNKGWAGLLRNYLNTRYNDVGQGFIPSFQKTTGDVDMWTYTGTGWYNSTGFGVMNDSKATSTTNDKATLSFNGTGITLLTVQSMYGGNIQINIDGINKGTFNLYNTTMNVTKDIVITGLAGGNHILEVKNLEDKALYIMGAYETKGNKGIRVNQNCKFGGTSSMAVSGENILKAEIDYFSPTLTIIEFQTNDYFNQLPIFDYKNNIQTLITRAKTFGDVILLPCGIREELDSRTIKQTQYIQALKELALSNNIVFMDIFNKWGGDYNYAKNVISYIYDTVHPNDLGHENIGNWIIDTIFC